MRRIIRIALATAALGLAATATPASAALTLDTNTFAVIADHDSGPSQVTINFDSPVSGLTSQLLLTLTGGTGNAFDFTYVLTKSGAANLVGFGFDTNPDLASVMNVTGPLAFFANTTFPASGNIEACFNGGNNCSAADGQAGSFSGGFTLNFTGSAPFTLNAFVDRYASIAALNNQSGEGHPFVPAVPEPATWTMMLLGFGGIGMAMRRGRKDGRLLQIA